MADGIRTIDEGKLGHRLLVRPTGIGNEVDLTNVGVGVSQVLPIIVMSLVSAPGSVLLFEQPELHLHPAVQSQLADFFIALSRSGRQCVVETHSEYLINRLRLRIAESDPSDDLKDQVVIHFVERTEADSRFRPVHVNAFGAIPDWPKGFFDQGPNESELILRAAMKKKSIIASRRETRS
jgi:predicted ATPase